MGDLREKLWKAGCMAAGALLSWPSVSKYLGTLPEFSTYEKWGVGVGFIFGLFFFTTKLVQKLTESWPAVLKVIGVVVVAACWLYLNWKLPKVYETALGTPNITPERFEDAKNAVLGLTFLWSTPLTYIGGVLGEKASGGPTP